MTYAIYNAYDIKDDLRDAGGTFSKELKAWIISDEAFEKLNSRTTAYGMRWAKGWAKARKEPITADLGALDI